jgi:ribosome-associated protein
MLNGLGFPLPYHEFEFETSRAQGAGGQHVNRTESAVSLRWNLKNSNSIPIEIKEKLLHRLHSQLVGGGDLIIRSQESRSQLENKEVCVKKLLHLLKKALTPVKKRINTRPTRSSQRKRVEEKKHRGEIKSLRRKPV